MELRPEDIRLFNEKIKAYSDYDFFDYSQKSFSRRLEKILTDYHLNMEQLLKKIGKSPSFIEELVKEITVNTTELFRDPELWISLKNDILPRFTKKENIKIWHVGMSSGQELYSMLILLKELELFDKTDIYGTDINSDMLEEARKGVYRFRIIADYMENYNKVFEINDKKTSKNHHDKYFSVDWLKGVIKINKELIKKPVLAKHNLATERNICETPFDLIICRNLLIYFNQELQNKTFYFFHLILKEDGILVLGAHESIMGNLVTKFEKRNIFYYKRTEF